MIVACFPFGTRHSGFEYERPTGRGPRGSHQLGMTPIWPRPAYFLTRLFAVHAHAERSALSTGLRLLTVVIGPSPLAGMNVRRPGFVKTGLAGPGSD